LEQIDMKKSNSVISYRLSVKIVFVILIFGFPAAYGEFNKATANKVSVYCYNILTGLKVSDNDANITATISKDGGAPAATGDTNPAEEGSTGVYDFDVNAAETNCKKLVLVATLADANYQCNPIVIYTDTNDTTNIAAVLEDTGTTIPALINDVNDGLVADITVINSIVNDANANATLILEDTGTTLPALINDTNDYQVFLANDINDVTLAELDDVNNGLVSAADVVTALMADTGITEGGTWTFEKMFKIMTAWSVGKWRDKAGVSGTCEVLDPDDGTTVIFEITPSATTPQKTVVIKI
jgi:hypothetical protein